MRELIYIGDRKVAWRERADPVLEARTDAIVRPVAATTCDVDKMIIAGKAPVPPPFSIGHESVAEVVETGDGVTHVQLGDLVVVPWHIACGRCDRCHDGLFAHCRTVPYMAMYGAPIGGDWGPTSSASHGPTRCSCPCRSGSTQSRWPRPATTGRSPGAWSRHTSNAHPAGAS